MTPEADSRRNRPLVSVIVPVFDGEKYLSQTLESVLSQTYASLEVIVIDDGSTDDSASIVRETGESIRLHYQGNLGTAAARNRGVEMARGHLLAFLDQDDLWAPQKLAVQVDVLKARPELEAVFCHVSQFVSPEAPESFHRRLSFKPGPMPGLLPSCMLIRKEGFGRVGAFRAELEIAEWTDWYIRMTEAGIVSIVLEDILASRRLHAGNQGIRKRSLQTEYPIVLHQKLQRQRLFRKTVDSRRGSDG